MFNTLLYQPIFSALLWLSQLTGNFGFAIIALTALIRLLLIPLTLPGMKAAVKMRALQPEIDALKKKFKKDPSGLQAAQLALFQKHQVNPAAGCLPYILQFVVLIALYRVFMDSLNHGAADINLSFLWLNLKEPDQYYVLPILAALSQLFLSLMIMPATSTAAEKTLATSTVDKKDDAQADDMGQMAATMQSQMAFVMPIMTGIIALRFPSGLALYWVVSTLLSLIQQYFVSGPGGLSGLPERLKRRLSL